MKLRAFSRMIVFILVIIVGTVVVVHDRLSATHATPPLHGTNLQMTPAPQFSLTDQSGAAVTLRQLEGHPVVLTFLYTHCPDECPLTAEKLASASQALGSRAADVRWVAISTDPVGDTRESATAFVANHHLTDRLQYLLGSQEQLAAVWRSYGVDATAGQPMSDGMVPIKHSVGVYLIDRQGRERIYLESSFDPTTLTDDLRVLLGE